MAMSFSRYFFLPKSLAVRSRTSMESPLVVASFGREMAVSMAVGAVPASHSSVRLMPWRG